MLPCISLLMHRSTEAFISVKARPCVIRHGGKKLPVSQQHGPGEVLCLSLQEINTNNSMT